MFFASDNGGPVHPKVMAALNRANDGYALPYGACDWTTAATALIRETFEAPEAEVWLVPTGTAANAISLAAMTEPWRRTYASDIAHIHVDEWGAPAFYAGGAELGLVPQTHGRMTPEDLATRIAEDEEGRRGPVSVTQVTEAGTVYDLATLSTLTDVAHRNGLRVHLDGARFANAAVALDCSAAQMTQGVAAVSFGGTKNGCMGVEAIVLLDPGAAPSLAQRRYRGGHTFSKHRYLAAQLVGYLEEGLWRETAQQANAKLAGIATALTAIPEIEIVHPPEANILFARMPAPLHDRLAAAGAQYYRMDETLCRLVCDWSLPETAIGQFLDLVTAGA